jgi:hypothetical protein
VEWKGRYIRDAKLVVSGALGEVQRLKVDRFSRDEARKNIIPR